MTSHRILSPGEATEFQWISDQRFNWTFAKRSMFVLGNSRLLALFAWHSVALQIESQHKAFSATWRWKPSANRHGRVRIQADWNNFKGVKPSSKSTSSNTKRKCWWSWSRSTCEHCVHLCSRVLTCFTLPLNNPRDWVCNVCIVCV